MLGPQLADHVTERGSQFVHPTKQIRYFKVVFNEVLEVSPHFGTSIRVDLYGRTNPPTAGVSLSYLQVVQVLSYFVCTEQCYMPTTLPGKYRKLANSHLERLSAIVKRWYGKTRSVKLQVQTRGRHLRWNDSERTNLEHPRPAFPAHPPSRFWHTRCLWNVVLLYGINWVHQNGTGPGTTTW